MDSNQKDEPGRQTTSDPATLNTFAEMLALLKFKFSNNYNAKYGPDSLAAALFRMCDRGMTANEASSRVERLPSSRWTLGKIRTVEQPDMINRCDKMLARILKMVRGTCLQHPVTICIDKHSIPRYDKIKDKDSIKKFVRTKGERGTHWRETYATMQIVSNTVNAVIGCFRVTRGYNNANFIRKFVRICARSRLVVGAILMDKEFFSVDVMEAVQESGKHFLIPASMYAPIRREVEAYKKNKRPPVAGYTMKSRFGKKFTFSLGITDAVVEKDGKNVTAHVAFATNMLQSGTRDDMQKLLKLYGDRWGIETGYRCIENVRPTTTSRNESVRIMLFYLALVMFGLWHMEKYITETYMTLLKYVLNLCAVLDSRLPPMWGTPHDPG